MTEQQRDRDIAEMEAQMAHDTDQYFNARPQIMRTRDKETTFEAGFKAAWKARALSHAEGEPVGTLTIDNYGSDEFRALLPAMDLEPGTYEVYTHPAPQVAGLTETAIKSSPAYRALHREKEHLLGLLKDQAPQVAVPEGFTVVPVREFYVMSEDEDIIGGIGNDFEAGKHLLKLAQEGEPEKAWGLVADIDQTKLAAAPTAPAGDLRPDCSVCGDFGSDCDVCGAPSRQPVSDPDGLGAERARRLETATVAKLLLNAWAESEPDHPVTKHPASYAETFTDMAKAMMPLMAAPDEREIAARAIERAVGDYFKAEDGPHNLHDYLLWRVNRLRAGKEGEPS